MEFFDSHSHYNDEKFDEDREVLLESIYKDGVTKLLCAGYSLEASKQAIEIAKSQSNRLAFVMPCTILITRTIGNIALLKKNVVE